MRLSRVLPAVTMAGAVCWVGGLIWFQSHICRFDVPIPLPHTDGIVALTGGAGRVESALTLLMQGQADKLLVSGTGKATDLVSLGRLAGLEAERFADRITLGRYALSTRGNAVETAAWVEQNHIGTLIVVTAAYHMPRALAELQQALPDVRLVPLPVRPGSADKGPGLKLEAEEYTKYLMAASGLSAWFPRREAAFGAGVRMSAGG